MSDDLGLAVKTLENEVVRLRKDVALALDRYKREADGSMEKLAKEHSRQFGEVMDHVDGFAGEVDATRRLRNLVDKSFLDIKERLDRHEARLYRCEQRGK